jgi:hypothetical protein
VLTDCDCNVCGQHTVELIDESEITPIPRRVWSKIYHCTSCNAIVGCHPNTTTPLGPLANAYTRKLRACLHEYIDPLWQSGIASRDEIYAWLAKELDVTEFHVSQLSQSQLHIAITIASKYHNLNFDRIKKAFHVGRYYQNRR